MKNILLITPPFTQLNTPYPATSYIKGFLKTIAVESFQMDLGIEVILELFSKNGLTDVFCHIERSRDAFSSNSQRIYSLKDEYIKTIDSVSIFHIV